jgi:hypothetical protein
MHKLASATAISDPDYLRLGPSLSSEFNQYMAYYGELLRAETIKKVVVVEEDPFHQALIENAISEYNPDLYCFFASSLPEVLNILRYYRCHLLVTEENLNGAHSGEEICNTVRQFYPETQCLLITRENLGAFKGLKPIPQNSQRRNSPQKVEKLSFKETLKTIFGGLQHAY